MRPRKRGLKDFSLDSLGLIRLLPPARGIFAPPVTNVNPLSE